MNHSVRSMIEMSFACLVFVVAMTVGLLLFQSGAAALELTYGSNQAADRNIHVTLSPIAGDGTVSGAEVLQSIAHIKDIGVEIVVDGTLYAVELHRENIRVLGIQTGGHYAASDVRGTHGELLQVIFTKI